MIEGFIKSPWAKNSLHNAYQKSILHMRPAPEYASGEVVLASTYRQVGFNDGGISESIVPALGRDLQKRLMKGKLPQDSSSISGMDAESFQKIISGTLRSPKQPNQAAKRFFQISPVVPDASIYSLSARLSSNSWNPGALVAKIIQYSNNSTEDAQEAWNRLFHSLSVDDNDDLWARFLQQEFKQWRKLDSDDVWIKPTTLADDEAIIEWRKSPIDTPASRFTQDLDKVLMLKNYLTRRQWISMLESVLRIGTASHVLWVCHLNVKCFQLFIALLRGQDLPSYREVEKDFSVGDGFWRYSQQATNTISNSATEFIKARLGINLLLHQLECDLGENIDENILGNINKIYEFAEYLSTDVVRSRFDIARFQTTFQEVLETDPRQVAGKKGIPSNIKEFVRHVLGQRQTSEAGMDSYDQGYYLGKKSAHRNSRWIVNLGPVSVLMLVHACTHGTIGPRTIDNLCDHLREYGVDIRASEISSSMLGQTLRNLGLVLDSPDAEGGMVLINPFEHITKEQ